MNIPSKLAPSHCKSLARSSNRHLARLLLLPACLLASTGFLGCVVMGGSTRGGFFIWPGGLGLLVMVILLVLLLRRR